MNVTYFTKFFDLIWGIKIYDNSPDIYTTINYFNEKINNKYNYKEFFNI